MGSHVVEGCGRGSATAFPAAFRASFMIVVHTGGSGVGLGDDACFLHAGGSTVAATVSLHGGTLACVVWNGVASVRVGFAPPWRLARFFFELVLQGITKHAQRVSRCSALSPCVTAWRCMTLQRLTFSICMHVHASWPTKAMQLFAAHIAVGIAGMVASGVGNVAQAKHSGDRDDSRPGHHDKRSALRMA